MSKNILRIIFIGTLLLSFVFIVLSLGWMAIFFGLLFLGLLILHIIAGNKALGNLPEAGNMLLLSCICLTLLFLFRPDFGDQYAYTAFSRIMDMIGLVDSAKISDDQPFMLTTVVLFVLQVIIDVLILFRKYIIK